MARVADFSRFPPAAAKPAYANNGRRRFPLSNKNEVKESETGERSEEIEFRYAPSRLRKILNSSSTALLTLFKVAFGSEFTW
jgi:hypothetical protein